ncbi:site-specific integrase [Luteibacter yeojuensis]|uniref:Tyrosine-type recombinase/integrase n=1 Tax=Luteibacter yeojuensis TaxID=345309 RepID=A0A7X5TPC1_9GAMM|nr:tyrosine-type recombinase/integrase [Luteibacter yeojuensis]NID14327.1 tyrosine-type recombinase/integrase [Luteibacter yeojuensis]
MGRKSGRPGAIPRLRLRKRGAKTYYFYDLGGSPRKEKPLGTDYALAAKKWGEMERDRAAADRVTASVITFSYVADRYLAEVVPTKSPRTQKDNVKELAMLKEYFNDPPGPLEKITPQHVKSFLVWRSKTAKVRANREKALLSHIWNWAREMGFTALANPCSGVKGNKETGRDIYIEDEVLDAVLAKASQPLKDALDLAYLTGQRVGDVLRMDETMVRDGFIQVKQGKTSAKNRIEVVGQLAALLTRIRARKATYPVHATRLIVGLDGQPLTYNQLYDHFRNARKDAGPIAKGFQMRDLRAKAGTDKAESSGDIRQAQAQLGHTTVTMTEHYVRRRRGDKVTPTK